MTFLLFLCTPMKRQRKRFAPVRLVKMHREHADPSSHEGYTRQADEVSGSGYDSYPGARKPFDSGYTLGNGATIRAVITVNKIAFDGILRLKSAMLWTRIAVIPDSAPKLMPRIRRLGFFSFVTPFR